MCKRARYETCMDACLHVYLTACLSVFLSVCLSVCFIMYASMHEYKCVCVWVISVCVCVDHLKKCKTCSCSCRGTVRHRAFVGKLSAMKLCIGRNIVALFGSSFVVSSCCFHS